MSISPPLAVGTEVELQVEKVTIGGHGVSELNGVKILVPGAIPGDRVLARISSRGPDHLEASVKEVIKAAAGSRPRREYAKECGGCIWQHIPYERQLALKEDIIRDALESLVPVGSEERKHLPGRMFPIIPSPTITHYRNKIELTFGVAAQETSSEAKPQGGEASPRGWGTWGGTLLRSFGASDGQGGEASGRGRTPAPAPRQARGGAGQGGLASPTEDRRPRGSPALGFPLPGTWNTVISADPCSLYDERLSTLLPEMQQFIADAGLSVYNSRTRRGVLRSLILRRGIQTNEEMLCFLVQARRKELEKNFQKFLRFGERPQVLSLLIAEHFSQTPLPRLPTRMHLLKGAGTIRERLFDLMFDLSPFSFFHCNTLGAEKLYASVGSALELSGREVLLDCYCGIGAIGQYLSRFCSHVVGVESHPLSIEDALRSAGKNKISNISFYHGRAEEVLEKKLKAGTKYTFDAVVLDPPRGGISERVAAAVLAHAPRRIAYVSSNPATLARDLGFFLSSGYDLRLVQPVDLFPHTAHVETVSLLQKK